MLFFFSGCGLFCVLLISLISFSFLIGFYCYLEPLNSTYSVGWSYTYDYFCDLSGYSYSSFYEDFCELDSRGGMWNAAHVIMLVMVPIIVIILSVWYFGKHDILLKVLKDEKKLSLLAKVGLLIVILFLVIGICVWMIDSPIEDLNIWYGNNYDVYPGASIYITAGSVIGFIVAFIMSLKL